MSAKETEIKDWIQEVGESQGFESHRGDENDIDHLHKLMLDYKQANQTISKQKENVGEALALIEEQGKLAESTLNFSGLDENALQCDTNSILKSLTKLYEAIDLNDLTSSHLMLGMNFIVNENSKLSGCLGRENKYREKLNKLELELEEKISGVEKLLEEASKREESEECSKEDYEERKKFANTKIKQYLNEATSNEDKMKRAGMKKDLFLDKVEQDLKEEFELRAEADGKHHEITKTSLPPDLSAAEAEVEELRQKLARNIEEITNEYKNSAANN